MSYFSQFGAGNIKSIQRGVTSGVNAGSSTNVSITSVNTSKSILTNLGTGVSNSGSPVYGAQGWFTLSDSITITFTNGAFGQQCQGSWQLVEYY